ncbi:hypothetical protein [Streptomyces sp.]|uniref:WXG100 family type VII secretion target n=1 Tax=Streptomyces sp. TaxID=1931 RepID=UPI002D77BF0A|nr:hypothetical protein [Streptomyces sp.]HET6360228.1 hypothetical protein [Streptomyces sp.]
MSHEDMLAWLDQANSAQVQAAADRLMTVYVEMGKIAQQLKFRPERVEWKGEGFQAFVDWGASLASATSRLADYSQGASEWMGRAAESIASVQSSIPRYTSKGQAQANLDAAKSAPNDTDSDAVAAKAAAALASTQEKDRLEAARLMSNLAGSYRQSSAEMAKLEVPTFQPPPDRFVPEQAKGIDSSQDLARSSDAGSGSESGSTSSARSISGETSRASTTGPTTDTVVPTGVARPERPAAMEIDSVSTLPETHATPPGTTNNAPPVSRTDGPNTMPPGIAPPTFGGTNAKLPNSNAPGRSIPAMRSLPSGQTGLTPRMPRETGITGGRQVPNTGRPGTGIPRSTVIGQEGNGRGPMGRPVGGGGLHGGGPMGGAGQNGISGGRRLASETGGVVGGRQQRPGQNSARPFTPGGSGLVRGMNPNSEGGTHPGQAGRAGAIPPGAHGANSRRDDQNGQRPDYLSEDEETWQQGSRRVVPPVID